MKRTLTLAKWRKKRQNSQDSSPEIKLNGPNPTGATMEIEIEGDLEAKGPGNEEEQHSEPIGTRETGDASAKKERVNEGDLEAKVPCNEEEQLSEPIGAGEADEKRTRRESERREGEWEAKGLGNEEERTVDSKEAEDSANTVHTQQVNEDNIGTINEKTNENEDDKTKITKTTKMTKLTKITKAGMESNKKTQKLLDIGETEAKEGLYTGRITRSMNGASPTDAWNRSRPSVGSGNGGRMLRSQVPKEGVERKGIT